MTSRILTSQSALDCMAEAREEVYLREEPVVLITVVKTVGSNPQHVGARMLLFADGDWRGTIGGGKIEARVLQDAQQLLASGGSPQLLHYNLQDIGMTCGGTMDFFLERIDPAPHLILFGGGHIAQPTAWFATQAGFRVSVVEERQEWANPERFPHATIHNLPFLSFLQDFQPHPNHYLVMVSQGHSHDKIILERVIAGPQRYTGVIGSQQKAHKLWKELRASGITEEQWATVRCPIGIPIGGQSPPEIAVSIVAQLIQCRRQS